MPFQSMNQMKYLNANPNILGNQKLNEFNQASQGLKLPKVSTSSPLEGNMPLKGNSPFGQAMHGVKQAYLNSQLSKIRGG